MPGPIFMKLGVYNTAPEPLSTAYFINLSHQYVCLYVNPLIIARQRLGKNPPTVSRQGLGKNITAATKTRATIEKFLDASFSMRFVHYQRNAGD
jgi:hypothetical protein